MATGYSVTVNLVDHVSKPLADLNKRIAASQAPFRRLHREMAKFSELTGIAKLRDGFKNLVGHIGRVTTAALKMVPIIGALTGAGILAGIGKLVTDLGNLGTKLLNTVAIVGGSVTNLQRMQNASLLAGSSVEAMTTSIQGLGEAAQEALGGNNTEFASLMQAYNKTFLDSGRQAKDGATLMEDAFDIIHRMASEGKSAASIQHAMRILRLAPEMTRFAMQGRDGLKKMRDEASTHPMMTTKQAESADKMRQQFDDLKLAVQGFVITVMGDGSQAFERIAKWASNVFSDPQFIRFFDDYMLRFSTWIESLTEEDIEHALTGFKDTVLAIGEAIKAITTYWKEWLAAYALFKVGSFALNLWAVVAAIRAASAAVAGAGAAGAAAAAGAGAAGAAAGAGAAGAAGAGAAGAGAVAGGGLAAAILSWLGITGGIAGLAGLGFHGARKAGERAASVGQMAQSLGWTVGRTDDSGIATEYRDKAGRIQTDDDVRKAYELKTSGSGPGENHITWPNAKTLPAEVEAEVRRQAILQGLDPDHMVRLAQREHGWAADSPAGAMSIMQIMPGTARELGIDPRNWKQSVEGGMRYYKQQYDRYGKRYDVADAAYNAGPNASSVQHFAATGDKSRLPKETYDYVTALNPLSTVMPVVPATAAAKPPASADEVLRRLRQEQGTTDASSAAAQPTALAPQQGALQVTIHAPSGFRTTARASGNAVAGAPRVLQPMTGLG